MNESKNNNYCNENMLDNSDYHYITKINIDEKKNDDKDDDNRNKIKNKAKNIRILIITIFQIHSFDSCIIFS